LSDKKKIPTLSATQKGSPQKNKNYIFNMVKLYFILNILMYEPHT